MLASIVCGIARKEAAIAMLAIRVRRGPVEPLFAAPDEVEVVAHLIDVADLVAMPEVAASCVELDVALHGDLVVEPVLAAGYEMEPHRLGSRVLQPVERLTSPFDVARVGAGPVVVGSIVQMHRYPLHTVDRVRIAGDLIGDMQIDHTAGTVRRAESRAQDRGMDVAIPHQIAVAEVAKADVPRLIAI